MHRSGWPHAPAATDWSIRRPLGRKNMSVKASKIYRVGVLVNRGDSEELKSLRTGMAQLGYVDGSNIVYEARFPEGQLDRLPGFAAELAAGGVDVIVTYGGPPTNAAR